MTRNYISKDKYFGKLNQKNTFTNSNNTIQLLL